MAKFTKDHLPPKPRPDFPLFPHQSNRWAKKIHGKLCYFGSILPDDPKGEKALAKWLAEKDYLLFGRTPPSDPTGLTVRDLVNGFLTAKLRLMRSGELSERTFRQYDQTCGRLVDTMGADRMIEALTPSDFGELRSKLAKGRGPVSLGNEITVARMVFKFGYDEGLIDRPIRYGQSFDKPSRKTLRVERTKRGPKMFEASEVQAMLEKAACPMEAFILLGINCAFGATDISTLPKSAIDLAGGWVDFPRGKTGIHRRCPLWLETVAAVQLAMQGRPAPKDKADDDLAFLTRFGHRWVKLNRRDDREGATPDDALGKQFTKLLRELKIVRPRVGFYSLRHTFRTIADDAKDQPAAGHIMGHHDPSMAAVYRERISDERLIAVCETVRCWVFG